MEFTMGRNSELPEVSEFQFPPGVKYSSAPLGTPDRTQHLRDMTTWHLCYPNQIGVADLVYLEEQA